MSAGEEANAVARRCLLTHDESSLTAGQVERARRADVERLNAERAEREATGCCPRATAIARGDQGEAGDTRPASPCAPMDGG